MKLLIFGASGGTGVHLMQQALADGYEVTSFVRHPQKVTLRHPKLSIFTGDVADITAVKKAITGHEAVVSALGAHSLFHFDQAVVNGLQHIVNVMEEAQVKRLVYLSTFGVAATRKHAGLMIRLLAPTLLRHEIRGHELREKTIRESSLLWTIVRAPILTNGLLTKSYHTASDLQSFGFAPKVSRADVAHCLLAQLKQEKFIHHALSIIP